MRLVKKTERAFVQSVVRDVKQISKSGKPTPEKVALLQFRAAVQGQKIDALRRMMVNAVNERKEKILDIIKLRARAQRYYIDSAKYIAHRAEHPTSLRQKPRMFAETTWDTQPEVVEQPVEAPAYPFMEFSS